jgi:transcriptional regulator with XRE-family HTH domain
MDRVVISSTEVGTRRLEMGLSQSELARRAGLSINTLKTIEDAVLLERKFDARTLFKLAKALDVDAQVLIATDEAEALLVDRAVNTKRAHGTKRIGPYGYTRADLERFAASCRIQAALIRNRGVDDEYFAIEQEREAVRCQMWIDGGLFDAE